MQPPGPKYVRRTLYLGQRLAYHIRDMAVKESWEVADLARAMILTGLTIREIHDMEEEVRGRHELITATEVLTRLTRGRVSRRYSRRGYRREGTWITVHLPTGFLAHIRTYAKMEGRSQNDALCMFLEDGLLCYLTGHNRFLKALAANSVNATLPK